MSVPTGSNKRAHSSTSDFDSNTSALDQSLFHENPTHSNKAGKKKKKKRVEEHRQSKMEDFMGCKEDGVGTTESSSVETKIDEINEKLSQMLTKNDRSFIREIIKSTIDEMKDQILNSVIKRIEMLESEIHDRCLDSERHKKDLEEKDTEIKALREENRKLKLNLSKEAKAREKDVNDLEQYGRRNNLRISGIPDDAEKQQSKSVEDLVVKTLNAKTNLCLKSGDIDIAHRLGKWVKGKDRTVIVRFVRRQTRIEVIKRAKDLKKYTLYVNEDLTRLNQRVLASLRLKDPGMVDRCWSFEGKLFVVYKGSTKRTEIGFEDYETWLDKPWPKKQGEAEISGTQ